MHAGEGADLQRVPAAAQHTRDAPIGTSAPRHTRRPTRSAHSAPGAPLQRAPAPCARAAGVYGLTYTAYILKLVLVDGVGLFNPAGGYVWAGLFGAAGVAALTA